MLLCARSVRSAGPEELPRQLNQVYDALITQGDRNHSSVIGFSGDAITCWFSADDGQRALACGIAMQTATQQFAAVPIPDGAVVALSIKLAVAAGPASRFILGDPGIQLIDVLAGTTLERLAAAEHLAVKGEIVLDPQAIPNLQRWVSVVDWRTESEKGQSFAVVDRMTTPVQREPWPMLEPLGEVLRRY